ncbi:3-oxoacyl-[acyl-carrier protein] reductase [Microbispora rosea]|uniref:3-oxoacyl-[acyl-carrier protein] reductase n=1 Tax=Microbispora rosea TaxID=58117 RepID=A0A1N7HG06_9ACTN|nr:glucose 1-dehydrogenase [Microbispora rosea]SIS23824.1 3-oxoacyl-[acyl-carrier protein] reductase [Microbispora rosea]
MSRSGVLADRVGVITGSGQGIGREFAEAFAAAGATVVVADLDGENAEKVAAQLRGGGAQALGLGVDVSDETAVTRMVEAAVAEFGRIDVLVNGAAIFSTLTMKPFEEIGADEWRKVIDVNVNGVFLCCRAVSATMRAQGSGTIVNISSSTVLGGRPNYLHYVTSKAAVVGMTRSLARELGPAGINVNVIMPGSVETGIPRDSARPEAVEQIVGNQALKRRIVSADIAGAAVFLASDAASMITGQSLVVDGGMNFL